MSLEQVLYTAHATATGGRDGRAVVPDSGLDLKLTTPKELGGGGGQGANPEQLFAAGYSACFIGAMKFVGARMLRWREAWASARSPMASASRSS
jgi:osmotically inducible protein OsmC